MGYDAMGCDSMRWDAMRCESHAHIALANLLLIHIPSLCDNWVDGTQKNARHFIILFNKHGSIQNNHCKRQRPLC